MSDFLWGLDNQEIAEINDLSKDYKSINHKLRVQRLLQMYKEQQSIDKMAENFD